jgi:DNA-directed RNA polymerase subunit RPC12/RpoP
MKCPVCNSRDLKKSKTANAHLAFPLSLLVVWVRCYHCGRKFRRFGLLPGNGILEAEEQHQTVVRCRQSSAADRISEPRTSHA